eukprot:353074-Amorphochlora_amoeboformis.AAC.1
MSKKPDNKTVYIQQGGSGPEPVDDDVVKCNYEIKLADTGKYVYMYIQILLTYAGTHRYLTTRPARLASSSTIVGTHTVPEEVRKKEERKYPTAAHKLSIVIRHDPNGQHSTSDNYHTTAPLELIA